MRLILPSFFVLVFFFSCANKGWSESARLELIAECKENAQYITSDGKSSSIMCLCVINKFIQDFSFEEYTRMTHESITNQSNPEIYNKLDIYIGTALEECNISL